MVDSVRLACVQLSARDVTDADRALDEAEAAAQEAAEDADVVVLPEATYPGYILHDEREFRDPKWWSRGIETFSHVARASGAYVVVGLIRTVGDRVFNTAATLSPDGDVVGVADKSFLWHFDSRWFAAGTPGDVLPLRFGKAGVFVCADARMMEIPRSLAVGGARLLCDTTALVLNPAGTNSQIEYMLAARAWENGSFLAVANKCGYEGGLAHYAGESAIYDPEGEIVARAGRDGPAIVAAEVDLARAPGPRGTRRPGSYGVLAAPDRLRSRAGQDARGPCPLRVAMAQGEGDERRTSRELAADVVVTRRDVSADGVLAVVSGAFCFAGSRFASGDVLDVGDARVGLLTGDVMAVPEEARCLMLEGAGVILWDRPVDDLTPMEVLRTRADENRVFLIVSAPNGDWIVIAPSGAIQARARPGDRLQAVLVELHLALAQAKEMAPGTDVVAHRQPERYQVLTGGT